MRGNAVGGETSGEESNGRYRGTGRTFGRSAVRRTLKERASPREDLPASLGMSRNLEFVKTLEAVLEGQEGSI
jgi:hypothetical protein